MNTASVRRLLGSFALGLSLTASAGTLSDVPLSLKGAIPPNVMFALSVEFPTANTAAYQDSNAYSVNNQYLGLFDDGKCYRYDSGNGWFYPVYATTTHLCTSGGWSGNLLNWATMTGLDEFRFAMTGGNRSTDTADTTVLERSYQSGQGGTGNFTDKTFTDTDSYSTTYPAGTALTFQNQGRGVQVAITPTSSVGVLNCTSPTLTGSTFSCTLSTPASVAGACYWWTGNGTLASPYTCTSVQIGSETPTTFTPVSPPTSTASGGSGTTVTCASPAVSGSTFSCGSITMTNGSSASCNAWTGNGSAASPYTCTAFSAFSHGETFFASGAPTTSSFSTTTTVSNITEPASGYISCTMSSGPTLTCPLSTGNSAKCAAFAKKSGTSKYACTGFGSTGSETITSFSNDGSNTTSYNSVNYYNKYRITYSKPVATTVYYTDTYPGSTSGYYYTPSYNYGFSGSQIFNVRVKVCDPDVGLEDNCKAYGSTASPIYKPTGVIQDNGNNMRFGVTSYFNANDIDNAVLRSKAKYVAPLKYTLSGTYVTNAQSEWSSSDGTLIANPDAADSATANSFVGTASNTGVINYINKFGSTTHSYKTYDTLGKLYYETLKYLRGKSATTSFYNGAKASNADGFPVINQWDDPVLYSCQKNYIITMGDTHSWCDKKLPGGTFTSTGSTACNAYTDGNNNAHTQDTGSLDGDSGSGGVDVTIQTNKVGALEGLNNLATTGTGVGTAASYSMAGLSQWAASQDTRGDLVGKQTVKTYVIDVEENKDCGYNSQFWYTAKYGNPESYDSNGNWLTSSNPWATTITLPGGACSSRAPTGYNAAGGNVTWPANLLRAGDPASMIASVRSAVTQIAAQTGNEAALAQSSNSLSVSTGAYLYQASFNSGGWSGDLQAYVIRVAANGGISVSLDWSASAQLPAAASRNIYTFNDGIAAAGGTESTAYSRRGQAFTSANFANLSSHQQALLNADANANVDSHGADRVNYVRGDQSKEAFLPGSTTPNPVANYGWRTRKSVFGDIVTSSPLFVAAPNASYASATYKTFANNHASRTPIIYVGANDGMLHAIDASYSYSSGQPTAVNDPPRVSGKEIFAYVPSAVYRNLSQLMAPSYSHRYFVDGSPTVTDACFGNCAAASDWKTVLLGSLNAGGQGIFALDVTDPASSFSTANVLWEFTDADDADLGFTFSKPIVAKLNNGKWAAIFGNGFNNTYADDNVGLGRAALYVLYLDGPGAGNAWVKGTNYFKIDLPLVDRAATPAPTALSPANGLATVTGLDADGNDTVDYVYAGDRSGNLWKIDLTSTTPSTWGSFYTNGTTTFSDGSVHPVPVPLFIAKDASSNRQQITTGIGVVPAGLGRSGYMAVFGTGAWIDTTDATGPFGTDTLYGIWDTPLYDVVNDEISTTPYYQPVSGRSELQKQKVIAYADVTGSTVDSHGNAYTASSVVNGAPVYGILSNCKPYYLAAFSTTNPPAMPDNVSPPLCPSTIAIGADRTGTQRGWYQDLTILSGERTRTVAPIFLNQGTLAVMGTVAPALDPCTGNTSGNQYNVDTFTGGMYASAVFAGLGMPSLANGSTHFNAPPSVARTSGQGNADTILTVTDVTPPDQSGSNSDTGSRPANLPDAPPAACEREGCKNFVPGWGFLFNMRGKTESSKQYYLDCQSNMGCTYKPKQATFGNLSWRQLTH